MRTRTKLFAVKMKRGIKFYHENFIFSSHDNFRQWLSAVSTCVLLSKTFQWGTFLAVAKIHVFCTGKTIPLWTFYRIFLHFRPLRTQHKTSLLLLVAKASSTEGILRILSWYIFGRIWCVEWEMRENFSLGCTKNERINELNISSSPRSKSVRRELYRKRNCPKCSHLLRNVRKWNAIREDASENIQIVMMKMNSPQSELVAKIS